MNKNKLISVFWKGIYYFDALTFSWGWMAQWVKALAAETNNLSLILGIHMVETKNQLLQIIL